MIDTSPNAANGDAKDKFDYRPFMAKYPGVTVATYQSGQTVYTQGDPADAIYYIVSGSIKISVLSEQGKEGIIAMLGRHDFFGEGCLDGRPHRISTITATSPAEIVRFNVDTVKRGLAEDAVFSHTFFKFILERNEKLKADLIDQLFNSSEKRSARILLSLANFQPNEPSSVITTPITQETLAHMVGTTRARVNQFIRKFSKLGHIEYNGAIRVYHSLHSIVFERSQNG